MAIIVESRNLPKKYQQQFTAETPLRRGPRRFFEAIIEVRRNLPKKYQQQFTAETRRAAEILFRAY